MSALLDRTVGQEPLRVHDLDDSHRAELTALVDADPIVNAVVGSRLHSLPSLDARRFGGRLVGVQAADGRLLGAAFSGGNLLPIGGGPAEWTALAQYIGTKARVCSSLVGRADAVTAMWDVLTRVWGPARSVRADQPLLVVDATASHPPSDVGVRAIARNELDAYLPAAIAMFTEELGISPQAGTDGGMYRRRISGLIREHRAFGVIDGRGQVIFKADFGAISPQTCQIQGVWVRPDLRGQGFGTAAMAAVLDEALAVAPSASLYVNDFNEPARRMYERLGMRQVATLSTVLLT